LKERGETEGKSNLLQYPLSRKATEQGRGANSIRNKGRKRKTIRWEDLIIRVFPKRQKHPY